MTIYQVLPRLFGNRNRTRKPHGSLLENGCGKLNDFNLKILREIKKLGATHIWYTGVIEHATQTGYPEHNIAPDHAGVVKGIAGSPYAIKDYYDIAPDLATHVPKRMQEFEALVERTHKAGLGAIVDFVPNHVARQYGSDSKLFGVEDLGAADRTDWAFSQQNNFYYMPNQPFTPQFDAQGYTECPARATGNDLFSPSPTRNDWYETVKLNYGVDYLGGRAKYFDPTPDTWLKMRNILLFWAAKGVDGFRCDMAEMVPVEFWSWAIEQVKRQFPHIIFIAEVYNPAEYRNYIFNGKFDYLYDKVGLYDSLRAIVRNEASAACITQCWQAVSDIQPRMLNFLENHDEQRIASDFFAGNAERGKPALLVSALMTASPFMLYFGQETGEHGMDSEGFSGRDGRTTIFDYWTVESVYKQYFSGEEKKPETQHLYDFYQRVLSLKEKEKALAEGIFYDLMWVNYQNPQFNPDRQFAFFRQYENDTILIIANFADQAADIAVNIPAHALEFLNLPLQQSATYSDLLSGATFRQELSAEKPFEATIPALGGVIFKFKNP
ncbi:MAG: alpha-amylase [Prevotellaceae bacterium]|jgi:glycosidase|nr:alpha-amylase [Prevotellaceae bacterium]